MPQFENNLLQEALYRYAREDFVPLESSIYLLISPTRLYIHPFIHSLDKDLTFYARQ